MNIIEASKSGLKKWITFSGRSSRSEFWYFLIFDLIFLIFNGMAQSAMSSLPSGLKIIASLISLALLVWITTAMISVTVRRLHDRNRSGWWYWIVLTVIGALFPLFVWYCIEGTKGPNRFGSDPLEEKNKSVNQ